MIWPSGAYRDVFATFDAAVNGDQLGPDQNPEGALRHSLSDLEKRVV